MSSDEIIEDDSEQLLRNIVAEAKKDDVITEDEENIISTIQRHLWDVASETELAFQEGKNTPEIIELLRAQLQNILEQARKTANEDGKITEEERALLDTLENYVSSDNVTGLLSDYLDRFV